MTGVCAPGNCDGASGPEKVWVVIVPRTCHARIVGEHHSDGLSPVCVPAAEGDVAIGIDKHLSVVGPVEAEGGIGADTSVV